MKQIKIKETDERKTIKISLYTDNSEKTYNILLSENQIKQIINQLK